MGAALKQHDRFTGLDALRGLAALMRGVFGFFTGVALVGIMPSKSAASRHWDGTGEPPPSREQAHGFCVKVSHHYEWKKYG